MNLKVKVSYDGTFFCGWAKQNNNISVQQTIEDALSEVLDEKINIFASGRTDKYVHAIDQCFNFKIKNIKIPLCKLKEILNNRFKNKIYIKSIAKIDDSFHSRFSIKSKTYLYKINTGKNNIFESNYVYQYCKNINLKKIKTIIPMFIGEKNFLSFSTSDVENTIRKINKISISKKSEYVLIQINGNGFLRNMVRMIVATFLNYNEDKITVENINQLFQIPKKGNAINKAPGCGLYLFKTFY